MDVPPTVVPGVVPTDGVGGSPIDSVVDKPTGLELTTVGDPPMATQSGTCTEGDGNRGFPVGQAFASKPRIAENGVIQQLRTSNGNHSW